MLYYLQLTSSPSKRRPEKLDYKGEIVKIEDTEVSNYAIYGDLILGYRMNKAELLLKN